MDKLLEESLFSTEQGILTMFFNDNSLFNKYEIEKGIYQTIHKLLE